MARSSARSAVTAAMLVAVLVGCGGSQPAAVDRSPTTTVSMLRHATLTVAGQSRAYRLFRPGGLVRGKKVPLVVVLHSGGNTGDSAAQTTQFDQQASTDGFIVVYPDGLYGSWNAGLCCAGAEQHHVDDVGFVAALLDRVEADYPVDASRVYVTGASNGAIMAYRLACELADRITAIGSVAGEMALEDCRPARPVSVLEIHGTADGEVPYQGFTVHRPTDHKAVSIPSSPALAARWARLDGCPTGPAVQQQPPVTTSSWNGCRNGTAVKLVTVKGGGHAWYSPGFGPVDGAVDATALIAGFFGLTPSTRTTDTASPVAGFHSA